MPSDYYATAPVYQAVHSVAVELVRMQAMLHEAGLHETARKRGHGRGQTVIGEFEMRARSRRAWRMLYDATALQQDYSWEEGWRTEIPEAWLARYFVRLPKDYLPAAEIGLDLEQRAYAELKTLRGATEESDD